MTRITEGFIASACRRLDEGKAVRRALPPWGRIHIDRQLPFLVVYRRPTRHPDPDTDNLVLGEASYLLASGERRQQGGISTLIESVASTLSESFGSFLTIEIWATADADGAPGAGPRFRVFEPQKDRMASTIEVLTDALGAVQIKGTLADVEVVPTSKISPPGLPALIPLDRMRERGWHGVGIEVRPIFRDQARGEDYPLVLRALHRGMSRALKRTVFDFTRHETTHRPAHYQALGRRSVVKAVWQVDRELAEVSNGFDFLFLATPVNTDAAWKEFRRGRFEKTPTFVSRPLKVDPALQKRKLYEIPVERIEDPTLEQLFRDQQTELDRRLTMLGDRGTPRFLYGSLQLFGGVDESLLASALEILDRIPPRSRDESLRGAIDAEAFGIRAAEELAYYRQIYPDVKGRVEVRDDVVGLMVSRGNLLIGSTTRIPLSRVEALIAHEVGTHVVTYVNGRAQPFRQLYVGLPGYDELQEGLAVLAECLVGGLSRPRLRLLAARVLAVHQMVRGATFVDVFRELDRKHDFSQRTAFNVTTRVFRGGGLTKDASYLRGLIWVLAYLRGGGELEPLFVGKLGPDQIDIIRELQWRKVLTPAPLRPRFLEDPSALARLEQLRNNTSVLDLVKQRR